MEESNGTGKNSIGDKKKDKAKVFLLSSLDNIYHHRFSLYIMTLQLNN